MPATTLDPKTALVVIDLQKGLAAYPTVHPFKDIVANNVKLANAFRAAKLPVFLVTAGPSADGEDWVNVRTDAPRHALKNLPPEFKEVVAELAGHPEDFLIHKRQPNAFFGTELDLQLRRRRVTGIVLTGVSTSQGVDCTARAANELGYNITFASDAMTDMDAASHEHILGKYFPKIGEIDTTAAILKLISR
jgi:nicotinamidase-related amidase